MPLTHELQTALAAVRTAAVICQAVQSTFEPETLSKQDKSPVTIADFASQAVICRQIREAFPDDPIVAEEETSDLRAPEQADFVTSLRTLIERAGISAPGESLLDWIDAGNHDGSARRFWTLDPIDGTKGFLRKEQFAISLALLENHSLQLAALACPNLSWNTMQGLLFYAVRGQGAWVVPLNDAQALPQQVHVSQVAQPAGAGVCESVESGHSAHDVSALILQQLGIQRAPLRMDSQAKYGAVASGLAEIYLRLPTRPGYSEKIWDHAGGVLVVEEAGGQVTDIHGRPLDFSQGRSLSRNQGVVVTNGLLHANVLAAVQSHYGA